MTKLGCVNHDCDKCKQAEQSAMHVAQPVVWSGVDFDIKTAPPPRQWVGLNSVDWNDFNAVKSNDPQYVAAWAEAKLKEKNNATTQPLSRDEVAARVFNEHFNKEKNT